MIQNQVMEEYHFESDSEFYECTFRNAVTPSLDLSGFVFEDCSFESCDLSLIVIHNTAFTRVKFVNCKLNGIDFSKASRFTFSVSFHDSMLDYCIFQKNNLKNTIFETCSVREAHFIDCDMQFVRFTGSKLSDTVFENNNLSKADFRKASLYAFEPDINKVKGALFSSPEVNGLLRHYNIQIENY